MYIPKFNLATDKSEIVAFMNRFSFATIVSANDNLPVATHLPFLVSMRGEELVLTSHFAKANNHWESIARDKVLVIFSEPHAYISPANYDTALNVPTWNYIAVHAYGHGRIISEKEATLRVLEATISQYEPSYGAQWEQFPEEYKLRMLNGIVAFEIVVDELQGKKKLSQNRSDGEIEKIIHTLSDSHDRNGQIIADYMRTGSRLL